MVNALDWTLSDISKELTNQWKTLSEEQKKPYSMYAYEDKERVKKEVEKIKATYVLLRGGLFLV